MLSRRAIPGLAVSVLLAGCLSHTVRAGTDTQNFSQIERGRYLTVVGDCAACHTQPGSTQAFAGGRPIETPFGNVLASNITPDPDTGIGDWSDDDFVSALKDGIGRDGKHLYPAMPYTYFTKITREDVLAIRAYLRTMPAVRNPVEENQLSFPFDVRAGLAGWNALYFDSGTYVSHPDKSPEWNRGAYLVEGLMHCGACHTPKSSLGGDKASEKFQGDALQGWFAPNLTNDTYRGLGNWTLDDIQIYLKTGHNRFAAASGPMAEEVALSSSAMTDGDLRAIATYLKDEPQTSETEPSAISPDRQDMKIGAQIYAADCSACHGGDGKGVAGLFPALAAAPAIVSDKPVSLIHVLVAGSRSVATDESPTAPAMPSFSKSLSNRQIASVATFIRNSWGNAAPAVTEGDVTDWRNEADKHSTSQ